MLFFALIAALALVEPPHPFHILNARHIHPQKEDPQTNDNQDEVEGLVIHCYQPVKSATANRIILTAVNQNWASPD